MDLAFTFADDSGHVQEATLFGIYRLDGDELRVCLGRAGLHRVQRPAEFETQPGVPVTLFTLARRGPASKQDKPARTQQDKEPARVGQILIVGNERTPQDVILKDLPLYPGQVLTHADLRRAEKILTRKGLRATVTVLNGEAEPAFKDVLIQIQEEKPADARVGEPRP
jgi:hypothetical protein